MNPFRIIRGLKTRILGHPSFSTDDVTIGRNVRFGRNVVFHCKRVRIGDGVVFQDNTSIHADHFEIGDYGTIYSQCFFPGGTVIIGHNFWLGEGSIVDGRGRTEIGNNVGVGAHSQLWTHMIFGDVMYGCRFHSIKQLVIEDDAWLVGHCLVSPVKVGARSLAMLGSVITKDMEADHLYAGVPASDITEKLGSQFKITSAEERVRYLQARIDGFAKARQISEISHSVRIVTEKAEMAGAGRNVTVFNVADRTYTKTGSELEHRLIRYLLPEVKFIPSS